MNIQLTYDYEVFFGQKTGTIENCLIRPVSKLLELFAHYDVNATFYIDVNFIAKAESYGVDLGVVRQNIDRIIAEGHDIQLHIHPHWENSTYENETWQIDADHYKLSDFSQQFASEIIYRSASFFEELTGYRAIAYRAGGWCLQPFQHIAEALYKAGIRVDSTIYSNGINHSNVQGFDFSASPKRNYWYFDDDPLLDKDRGRFLEIPIANISVSPLFFWKFAFAKKLGGAMHNGFGDGSALSMSRKQMLKLLTLPSTSVASLDGYKATLLEKCYQLRKNTFGSDADLVFIGHPKSLTQFSLTKLEAFIKKHSAEDRFCTVSQRYNEISSKKN